MRFETFNNTSREQETPGLPGTGVLHPLEKKIEGPKLTPEQNMAIRMLSGLIKRIDAELSKAKGNAAQEKRLLNYFDEEYKKLSEHYNFRIWEVNFNIVSEELKKIHSNKEYLESSEEERVSAYDYLKKNYFPMEISPEIKNKN